MGRQDQLISNVHGLLDISYHMYVAHPSVSVMAVLQDGDYEGKKCMAPTLVWYNCMKRGTA